MNSYLDGNASLPLPAGRYHIRAEKGMEYRKATEDVEIHAGEAAKASRSTSPTCSS